MAVNRKCPKCGSNRVQLSNEESKKSGCMWWLLFGWWYWIWILLKWTIGTMIFCFYDSWMSIVAKSTGKGYVWQSKKWFSTRRQVYYCHDCGYNFRA